MNNEKFKNCKECPLKELEISDALLEAAKPLIKYLAENYTSHVHAIVTDEMVELFEAFAANTTEEFLRD